MDNQHNIKLETIDYIIISIAFFISLCSWLYVIIEYAELPSEIPTHFTLNGEIDGHGSKDIIWLVMGLLTILNVGLFYLSKATSFHSIQLKSRIANFRAAAIYMPFLSIVQGIVVYSVIESAKGTFQYSQWMLPSILTITGITLIVMFTIIFKNK
ncbi:DUF1648 domain-containing protein [Flavobacteriaceae bacterium S356]|uniref:DUF1648 domain-containing protein n=1 Tax=Asprobacillus argus TaxID=3076534 RepID=A0ABU3LGU4_9FLAO|nr:DUF1648 domain-containing protein [Flavobacteriaceae bacterium S356]